MRRPTDPEQLQFPGSTVITWLVRLEELLLTIMLTAMIGLACYQIGLRWFTSGGISWIDPLLRYLVLWGGLLGGALATAENKHISMDVLNYLLPRRILPVIRLAVAIFSFVVAIFLFRATLLFIHSEIEFGGTDLLGWPIWLWNLIFPISFGLIALHFGVSIIAACFRLISAVSTPRRGEP